MTRVLDISLGIAPSMMVWPSDPPMTIERTKHLATDGSNVSEITLGTHTGTHVDPPIHFIDGAATVDEIPPDVLVGPALVVDLRHVEREITPAVLAELDLPDAVERILFLTRNSELWRSTATPPFPDEYVALTPDGARWLADRGVRLVGTDFLSIEKRGTEGHPTHVALLERGIVIVEGLDLSLIEPGDYVLACLPLKLVGGDGAPARAVLLAGE